MQWMEIQKQYPDQWVVVAEYKSEGAIAVHGSVVAAGKDRRQLSPVIRQLLPRYKRLAIHHTGILISESDLPILWRITRTKSSVD